MTINVTHLKVSALPDGSDPAEVQPSDWNDDHVITGSFADTDEKAKVSSNDTTAGYLNGKLVAGTGVTLTENNDGSNETLTIAASVSPSFATPSIALGTAADAGAASTVIRSDATILAFDATTPATQALGDAGTVGVVSKAARRDHKHPMPTAAVTTSGLTQATGKLLGRSTASTGAIEEITVGTGLSLSSGSLTAIGGSATITTKDEGSTLSGTVNTIDFVGAGVVASGSGSTTTVTISGGGSGVTVSDEGTPLTTTGTTLDFVGAGVTATGTGATKTITIPGGGGSSFSGARVYRSTDQALTGGGGPILCNSERYDTDSYHSTVSNTSRLTVPTTATYHFGATVEFEVLSGAGTYSLFVSLILNGSDEIAIARLPGIATLAGSTPGITVSCDWACTAGDYAELWVQHTAPSAQADSSPPRSPEFWVHRLG